MHPAYSVIVFTIASGGGYGLLFWLTVLAVAGAIPANAALGFWGQGLGFVLITAGLLSSTAHLGRPERAWLAFSQWRTSWLSREGVLAIATYLLAGLFAVGWVVFGTVSGAWAWLGLGAAALAMATVWCTGMIYQSLPTIRAWSLPHVSPVYVVLSLATGAILTLLVLQASGQVPRPFFWITIGLLGLALVLKRHYWATMDDAARPLTPGDATGLGRFGKVRQLDPPHTQANYVMREMGYQVARKHVLKLRGLVQLAGVGVPLLTTLIALGTGPAIGLVLAMVSVIAVGIGVTVERWLFFAEAQHVVTLYYGAEAA